MGEEQLSGQIHMNLKLTLGVGLTAVAICTVCALSIWARGASSEEDRLLGRRVIRLRGPIDDTNANAVIARLLYLQQVSPTEPIHLFLDSPGGGVSPGLAIIDTIEMLKPPVHTHCEGMVGSMALVILTHGHRGERSMRESSKLLFSMPQAPKDGSAHQKAEAERFGGILIGKVVSATGIPEADVQRMFQESMTVEAKQAVRLGLIDKIE